MPTTMRRQLLLASTMLLGFSLFGNDADVLRYQYKRTSSARPTAAPAAPAPRPALRTRKPAAKASAITASIRLEPR
jgi:hypothetical protein